MFLWAFIIRIRQAFKNASCQSSAVEIDLRAFTHIGLIATLLLNSVLRFLLLFAALDARRDGTNSVLILIFCNGVEKLALNENESSGLTSRPAGSFLSILNFVHASDCKLSRAAAHPESLSRL
jgi:hypothetical protein